MPTYIAMVFFESVIQSFRTRAQSNRAIAQQLAGQLQRQTDSAQTLAREAAEAYMDFINSMFSFYQGSFKGAERSGRPSTTRNTNSQPRSGKLPLASYDSLNAKAVIDNPEGLSAEEVRRLRDYETQTKKRPAPMERFNSGIEAIEADLPLANYDSLDVVGVMDRIEGLDVEEIKRLRDYEARTKNRPILVRLFDARIEAAWAQALHYY